MWYPNSFKLIYDKSPLQVKKALYFLNTQRKRQRDFILGLVDIFRCRLAYKKPPEGQKFQPLVSVLLTSYNRPQMLREAVESVLSQTYQNFELIILDDNSGEETQKVIAEYLKNPKVRFYKSDVKDEDRWKEARYAVLINVGLDMAKGELIAFLCDDDYFLSQKLEKMVRFLHEHPGVMVCYNRQIILPGNKLRKPDRILKKPGRIADAVSVMYYKSCVDEIGNWETGRGEERVIVWIGGADAIFFDKLGARHPFYPIREVLDVRRNHPENISAKMARGEHLKS